LIGGRAPHGVGVSGAGDPLDVAGSLVRAAGAHPGLLMAAGVLAVAAIAVPTARARGRWGALALGALLVFPALAGASALAIASLVLCAAIVAGCAAVLPAR
ncbi:MAG TPA: hypothetical protein VHD91_04015, partial [Gaiellaceae bacterium]|nr:hypothetical protein [Gaiellaceae bacterium]